MENVIASFLAFIISLCFAALIVTGIYARYERIGWCGWLKNLGVLIGITGGVVVGSILLMIGSIYVARQIVSLFF